LGAAGAVADGDEALAPALGGEEGARVGEGAEGPRGPGLALGVELDAGQLVAAEGEQDAGAAALGGGHGEGVDGRGALEQRAGLGDLAGALRGRWGPRWVCLGPRRARRLGGRLGPRRGLLAAAAQQREGESEGARYERARDEGPPVDYLPAMLHEAHVHPVQI